MGYLHSQSTHPHMPLSRSPGPQRCAQLCKPLFHHLFPAVESKILPYLFLHYFIFLYGKQLPQPFLCAVITFLVPMYWLSSPHLLASFQYFDPLLFFLILSFCFLPSLFPNSTPSLKQKGIIPQFPVLLVTPLVNHPNCKEEHTPPSFVNLVYKSDWVIGINIT